MRHGCHGTDGWVARTVGECGVWPGRTFGKRFADNCAEPAIATRTDPISARESAVTGIFQGLAGMRSSAFGGHFSQVCVPGFLLRSLKLTLFRKFFLDLAFNACVHRTEANNLGQFP